MRFSTVVDALPASSVIPLWAAAIAQDGVDVSDRKSACPPQYYRNNSGMHKSTKEDANQAAAGAVAATIAKHEMPLPREIEAAWKIWSAGVGRVDATSMALLRTAFIAGAEAAAEAASKS